MGDERPTKRARLAPRALPDGFAPSKSKPRPMSAPVFVSGFDVPTSNALSSTSRSAFTGIRTSAARPPAPRPPPVPFKRAPIPRPDFGIPLEPPKSRPKAKAPLRLANPPVWAPIPGPSSSKTKALHPISSFRHVLSAPDNKPAPKMFRLSSGPPQVIMPPPKKPLKPLKPLRPLMPPPFPVLKPKFPPGTKLMPITKTPIALATDIHTESGLNHLLSLHIEQHGTGYVPPMERELRRGLEQSPEKKSKAKEAKYLMGGLAATAARRIASVSGNQTLWELSRRSGRPDVRLRVVKIIQASPPPAKPKSPHAPPTVLARCEILTSQSVLEFRPHRETLVLFRVSENPRMEARMKERLVLKEGIEVCVFRPWLRVDVPPCNVEGNSSFIPAVAGSAVWFCQRYYVPPPPETPTGMLPM